MDVILSKVNTALLDQVTVLDISYYPAKVITSTCKQFTQTTGPNSKTLQNMGWYPSGKLVILPHPTKTDSSIDKNNDAEEELLKQFLEWQSRNVLKHEEFAYNNPNAANNMAGIKSDNNNNQTTSAGNVQWTGVGVSQQGSSKSTTLKPSEIFTAVETRADAEIQLEQQQRQANTSNNNKSKKKKKPTEKERAQRLDALLQNIDNNKDSKKKKKKAVSAKVRQMLLKQRSEGNKKLRMEDRFHLELVRLWDVPDVVDKQSSNDGGTSYKFFSRQSTAGRVASSIASNLGKDISSELLVVYPPLQSSGNETQTEKRYRRLPNTMSLHDAQSAGYVNEFDIVVIRIYALSGIDGGSKSVLEEESDSDNDDMDITEGSNDKEDEVDIDTKLTSMEVDSKSSNAKAPLQQPPQEQSQQDLQQRIHAAFQCLEDNSSNPAKKKKKPSKQVRSMLIKSKSTGNVRVKSEERLYLEVILFHDDQPGSSSITKDTVSSSYRFFSKLNDMQHIITVCGTGSKPGKASDRVQVELIVERPDNNSAAEGSVYKALPKALKLGDAIQQGYIENFGRVLIRICNNDESYLPCDNL